MDRNNLIERFRNLGLLPFQADFLYDYLVNQDKKSCWQFISPSGTGKSYLVKALIAFRMESNTKKHILVLAPAALLNHWRQSLSNITDECFPQIIDRKSFLELENNVPIGENPWHGTSIIIMSIDLAKRKDMLSHLCEEVWDQVIIDESHLLAGKRMTILNQLIDRDFASNVLLLSAVENKNLSNISTKNINIFEIKDWNGKPLYVSRERQLHPIFYKRSEEECLFLDKLQNFADKLKSIWTLGDMQAEVILSYASSSIYNTESVLRRLQDSLRNVRNKIVHDIPITSDDLEDAQQKFKLISNEVKDEFVNEEITVESQKYLELYADIELLLYRIEDISTDSKQDAIINHIMKYCATQAHPSICVLSSYINTIEYLTSRLEGLAVPVYSITSSLKPKEKNDRISEFSAHGGVCISSNAAIEGFSLEHVEECINYDLPLNMNNFDQRWLYFLREGRKKEFMMFYLKDESESFIFEEDINKFIEGKYVQ